MSEPLCSKGWAGLSHSPGILPPPRWQCHPSAPAQVPLQLSEDWAPCPQPSAPLPSPDPCGTSGVCTRDQDPGLLPQLAAAANSLVVRGRFGFAGAKGLIQARGMYSCRCPFTFVPQFPLPPRTSPKSCRVSALLGPDPATAVGALHFASCLQPGLLVRARAARFPCDANEDLGTGLRGARGRTRLCSHRSQDESRGIGQKTPVVLRPGWTLPLLALPAETPVYCAGLFGPDARSLAEAQSQCAGRGTLPSLLSPHKIPHISAGKNMCKQSGSPSCLLGPARYIPSRAAPYPFPPPLFPAKASS